MRFGKLATVAVVCLVTIALVTGCVTNDPYAAVNRSLENTQEAAIINRDVWQGHPLATRRLPDSAELQALIRNHGKSSLPVGAEDLPTPSKVSWISQFGKKVLDSAPGLERLEQQDPNYSISSDATDYVELAALARGLGHPELIVDFEALFVKKYASYLTGSQSNACKKPLGQYDGADPCAHRAWAISSRSALLRLRGDFESARQLAQQSLDDLTAAFGRIRVVNVGGNTSMDTFHAELLHALIVAQALDGRTDAAVANLARLMEYSRIANSTFGIDIERILRILYLSGKERVLHEFIRLAEDKSFLASVDDLQYLFSGIDMAIARSESVELLRRRIAFIGSIRDSKPEARALWYNGATLRLECSLGHIFIAEKNAEAARRQFDTVLASAIRFPSSLRDIELCLWQLAPHVGREEARSAISELMQRQFNVSAERVRAVYTYQSRWYAGAGDRDMSAQFAALGRLYQHISPTPEAWNFIDDDRAEKTLISALDATKDPAVLSFRGRLLVEIAGYTLAGWRKLDAE